VSCPANILNMVMLPVSFVLRSMLHVGIVLYVFVFHYKLHRKPCYIFLHGFYPVSFDAVVLQARRDCSR
jgi:hypothetical protein